MCVYVKLAVYPHMRWLLVSFLLLSFLLAYILSLRFHFVYFTSGCKISNIFHGVSLTEESSHSDEKSRPPGICQTRCLWLELQTCSQGCGPWEKWGWREHCELSRSLVWSLTLAECLYLTLFPVNEKYYLSIQCSAHFCLANFVLWQFHTSIF